MVHRGEEPVISGTRGSGTIFFSGCNLRCVYCQNARISQECRGGIVSVERLSDIMLELQDTGVHNINLVTPTHFTPQIRAALVIARQRGLSIPIVWNSSGYESVDTLRSMDGLVDIYLPDFRYANTDDALRYSNASDYPERARAAIQEMYRQVGHLRLNDDGVAERGLLVRVLVFPGGVGDLRARLEWLSDAIDPLTRVSLMAQYYPAHRAAEFPPLDRPLSVEEYHQAVTELERFGLFNGFTQEVAATPEWTPDFQ
jgi:putative pyruvate formate lyase activating enzyme